MISITLVDFGSWSIILYRNNAYILHGIVNPLEDTPGNSPLRNIYVPSFEIVCTGTNSAVLSAPIDRRDCEAALGMHLLQQYASASSHLHIRRRLSAHEAHVFMLPHAISRD